MNNCWNKVFFQGFNLIYFTFNVVSYNSISFSPHVQWSKRPFQGLIQPGHKRFAGETLVQMEALGMVM